MWQQIFDMALNHGIWAVLFVALFVYQMKDSKEREQKYQATIKSLTGSLQVVKQIEKTAEQTNKKVVKLVRTVAKINKKQDEFNTMQLVKNL